VLNSAALIVTTKFHRVEFFTYVLLLNDILNYLLAICIGPNLLSQSLKTLQNAIQIIHFLFPWNFTIPVTAILTAGRLEFLSSTIEFRGLVPDNTFRAIYWHSLQIVARSHSFSAVNETPICWQFTQVLLWRHVSTTRWVIDLSGRVKWLVFLSCYAPFQGNLVFYSFTVLYGIVHWLL